MNNKKAFTLVELLVVIALIGIFASGLSMFTVSSQSQSLDAGLRVLMNQIHAAQLTAKSQNVNVRVMINSSDNDKMSLKKVTYAIEQRDDNNSPTGNWICPSRGEDLPDGVFVVPPASLFNARAQMGANADFSDLKKSKIFNIGTNQYRMSIPLIGTTDAQSITDGGDWFYIEFEPDGSTNNTGSYFTLSTGRFDHRNSKVIFSEPFSIKGFCLTRTGAMVPLKSYEEVKELSNEL